MGSAPRAVQLAWSAALLPRTCCWRWDCHWSSRSPLSDFRSANSPPCRRLMPRFESSCRLFSARMPGISRRQNRSLFRQLEFCFETQPHLTLPSAGEMRDRAAGLLRELKVDKLARRLRVEWNPRMRTTVGRADYSRSLISLNPALQSFGLDRSEERRVGKECRSRCA